MGFRDIGRYLLYGGNSENYNSLNIDVLDKVNILHEWSLEVEKRRTLDQWLFDHALFFDVTHSFQETYSKLVKKAVEGGGKVYLARVPYGAGLLGYMRSEKDAGADVFEMVARILSDINDADGFSHFSTIGTELKTDEKNWNLYQKFLAENGFNGAGKGKKYFVTGEDENAGYGLRYNQIKETLSGIEYMIGDGSLILMCAGEDAKEALENAIYNMYLINQL